MRSKKLLALVACFVFCGVVSSHAGYMANIGCKLARGCSNIVGLPYEIFANIEVVSDENGSAAGATYGTCRGLFRGLTRGVVGVYEIVTFPIPQEQIVGPEFVVATSIADYEWEL